MGKPAGSLRLSGVPFEIAYTSTGSRERMTLGEGADATTVHYLGKLTEIREVSGGSTYVHRVSTDAGVTVQVEVNGAEPPATALRRVRYLVADHLGSPALAMDEGGETPERFFYEPNGRRVKEDGAPLLPGGDGGRCLRDLATGSRGTSTTWSWTSSTCRGGCLTPRCAGLPRPIRCSTA